MARVGDSPHLNALAGARLDRRRLLQGLGALPLLSLAGCVTARLGRGAAIPRNFTAIAPTQADRVTVPAGYTARTLISWGWGDTHLMIWFAAIDCAQGARNILMVSLRSTLA